MGSGYHKIAQGKAIEKGLPMEIDVGFPIGAIEAANSNSEDEPEVLVHKTASMPGGFAVIQVTGGPLVYADVGLFIDGTKIISTADPESIGNQLWWTAYEAYGQDG